MIARYWQQFATRFNQFAPRERLILLIAVIAVLYLLWPLVFLTPISNRIETLETQLNSLDQRQQDLHAQAQVFGQAAGQDPQAGKKRQVNQLRERLAALDEELQTLAVGLVPADMLPQVLHDVLSGTEALELVGMQTLPVQKLAITETEEQAGTDTNAEQSPQQVDVYRHAVEVKVRGSYFVIAEYLQALEGLPWRFYWDKLDYLVGDYPKATATLEVYTLSAGEGPLGE